MMAYIFADIIHEAIGHGLTSLILGNKITLLTSVYFRSEKHSFITDACGPLLNLAAGLLVLVFLKRVNIADLYVRLLLVLTAAFNFFWFSWMCIYSGFTNKGDFAFYISSPIGVYVWQFFLIISGFLSYYLTFNSIIKRTGFQSVSTIIDSDRLFLIPYLAAGIFSFIAVSFYLPWSFNNFYEAFVFPMFLPTVFLSIQPKNSIPIEKNYTFEQQKILILAGIILLIVFCLTMGIGIRP
ncbi:hypothetical protein [Emticicia fontis]